MAEDKKTSRISETVTWRKAGEKAVILDMDTSEYYSANDTGTFIWELLSAGKKPEAIASALAEEYGVDRERAGEDTAAFLKDLAKLGIIVPEAKK
jgi:hypothetical protein